MTSNRQEQEDQGALLSAHELHVTRLLGQGAYASVYLASRGNGNTVAVKVLHDVHRKTGCTAQKLFVREALLMNRVTHTSILKAHGLYRISGSHPGLQGPSGSQHKLCFLMEHANGGSMARLLTKQMQDPWKHVYSHAQALTWLIDIAEGLQHLHGQDPPLIHRDIKLDNILLHDCHEQERMVARITDLGLHVVLKQQRRSLRVSTRSLLQAGLPALPPLQPQRSRLARRPISQPASAQVSRPASPGLPDASTTLEPSRVSSRLRPANVNSGPEGAPKEVDGFARVCKPHDEDSCAVLDTVSQRSSVPSRQHSFILDAPALQHIFLTKGDHPSAASESTFSIAKLMMTSKLSSKTSMNEVQGASGTSGTNPDYSRQASSLLHTSLPDCSALAEASMDKPSQDSGASSPLNSTGPLKITSKAAPNGTDLQLLGDGLWDDDSAWPAMLSSIVTQPLSQKDWQWVFSLTGQTGSAVYMAPEVHSGEPYNTSADVHSFGILAYELLARSMLVFSHIGTAALPGVTTAEGFAECIANGYRPARPDCIADAAVWSLIEDCWHPDPNTRPSMAALLPRLQQALQARLAAGDQLLQVRGMQAGCTADCSIM